MILIYPFFLIGLLTLVIPVLIHFFELRKPQRVAFTNVGFIRRVEIITATQRKVKHLLILLCRLLFLTFLVLTFCQPFIPAIRQEKRGNGNVRMLLDTSASMQALDEGDLSVFEQGVREAQALTKAYPSNTQFLLNTSRVSVAAEALQKSLEGLEPSANGYSAATLLTRQMLGGNEEASQLFVLSDFQKNDFSVKNIDAIDSSQQVFMVPLTTTTAYNVYVDSVWIEDAFVRINDDLSLHVRLRNGGNVTAESCRLKIFVGDRQVSALQTAVPVNQAVDKIIQIRLPNREQQLCRVEIEDLPVSFDNTYFFTLRASPPVTVLDVAAHKQTATQNLYSSEALFTYTKVQPTQLDYAQLRRTDLILLQELPQVEDGLRDNIRQKVKEGGTLVIIPPVATAGRDSYTRLFQDLGISGLAWEPIPAKALVLREVAMPDLQNPFFRGVFTGSVRRAAMPKAAPVLRWSRSTDEILRFQDGGGYLARFVSGRGNVFVFAAPFSAEYSDFTSQALFVPVLYRLAMQSHRQVTQPAYRLNQSSLAMAIGREDNGEQIVKLTKDSLTFIPAQRVVDGELQLEIPVAMHIPGFYSLTRKNKKITSLAFNVDKRESELERYSAAELRQLIGPDRPNIQVYDVTNGESVGARYRTEHVGTPLWRYCLWAALFFLLAEIVFVRFSGKRVTASRIVDQTATA